MSAPALVTRLDVRLLPDSSRVLANLFVPGLEIHQNRGSRASGVLARILDLSEETAEATLADVRARFRDRHRDLDGILAAHYGRIAHRIPDGVTLSDARKALLGAWFTNEFAIEGAALFNPSLVAHPDQSGMPEGSVRFVMSLRAVGEGHISCIEFRTGVWSAEGTLTVDDPGPHVESGVVEPTWYDRELFGAKLADEGLDAESEWFLLGRLPPRFHERDLEAALFALSGQRETRAGAGRTSDLARRIVQSSYEVTFAAESTLAERVLWPSAPTESKGLEDARFVRFTSDSGEVGYRATYTAYDGANIAPQLIETSDFAHFRVSQLAGPAARNKGMALFPRTVGGRHFALSRHDRENTAIASSADGRWWGDPKTLHGPDQPWELIQTGNCGSPLETEAGWLVLTHGVGPMREYAIGALLLDLDDPTKVVGDLGEPLLRPAEDEREGYVPNVVYSCGGLLHGGKLLIPYGVSDSAVAFAVVDVPLLLERMTGTPSATRANSSA